MRSRLTSILHRFIITIYQSYESLIKAANHNVSRQAAIVVISEHKSKQQVQKVPPYDPVSLIS